MLLKIVLVDSNVTNHDLKAQEHELKSLLEIQNECQHLATYQAWNVGTASFSVQNQNNHVYRPIYLVRPHSYSTLSNRIVTRPFLSNAEKMFIAHQILSAVELLHSKGYCHGHLTCDNVGLSSWNWVVLMDILPKGKAGRPTFLAEDDPTDWIMNFQERGRGQVEDDVKKTLSAAEMAMKGGQQSSGSNANAGEKRCYLAPERFAKKDKDNAIAGELTPAMDIFSLGCVLMELFLNGEPAMDLGDLMEYRQNENGISEHTSLPQRLNKIESGNMRAACRHMLHLDPRKRLSAGEYLKRLTSNETPDDKQTGNRGGSSVESTKKKTAQTSSRKQAPPLPSCHESVFLPLLTRVRCEVMSPDARIALAAIYYGKVIRETVGVDDVAGAEFFCQIVGPTMMKLYSKSDPTLVTRERHSQSSEQQQSEHEHQDGQFESEGLEPCEIAKVSCPSREHPMCNPLFNKEGDFNCDELLAQTARLLRDIEMKSDHADEVKDEKKEEKRSRSEDVDSGAFRNLPPTPSSAALVIFVQFVLSTIRHTQRPSSKLVGMQLLLRLAKFSSDEVRLQRIVPTLVSILKDTDASVRAMAINILTAVLAMIEHFPPSDAQAFPQYILKRISHLVNDPVLMVKLAFVESMAQLAETALRFLDTCHAIKVYETVDGEGSFSDDDSPSRVMKQAMKTVETAFGDDTAKLLGSPLRNASSPKGKRNVKNGNEERKNEDSLYGATSLIRDEYDRDIRELHETFARWVVSITTDTSDHASSLKQAILKDIARICQFFGNEGVMTCILPQILAFLNHRKDWQLRAALCRHLPSVCAIVGRAATEQFVVPCVETALIDDEDLVISSALRCLASLVEMGLLTRVVLLGTNIRYGHLDLSSVTMQPPAAEKSKQGILEKYSALLVYPSDDVRYASSFLFATCSRTIGFPDDEVLVMPIIRPFLRHDIHRARMLSTDGIMSSLMPPLGGDDFSGDFASLQFNEVREHHTDEAYVLSFIAGVKCYLSMCRRSLKQKQENASDASLRVLHDEIEEHQKAAFSVYLPNQKYAELITKPLPEWYEQLRQMSCDGTPFESSMSALRTMSVLSKVYALTILQPPHSAQPQRMWKGDFMTLDLGFENSLTHDGGANEKELQSFLSDQESKAFTGAWKGEWGALSLVDPVSTEMSQIVSKLASVNAPAVPPRLGSLSGIDGKLYSCHAPARPSAQLPASDTIRGTEWKPKVDVLSCCTSPREHSGPITRLAISHDQAFFVTASHDGTCKVFETRQIHDSSGGLKSCLTIGGDAGGISEGSNMRVNDVTIIENSHSVASGNSDGSVQVWRVDMVSNEPSTQSATVASAQANAASSKFARVSGFKMLRKVDAREGEISAVSHFNTNSASIVTFASQMCVHSWDLRCAEEPFVSKMYSFSRL